MSSATQLAGRMLRLRRYRICDERFYSYWVPGLVELIFPDWF